MKRVERTIVIEGGGEWVDRVLGSSLVDPDRPYECPRGTVRETHRAELTGGDGMTAIRFMFFDAQPVMREHVRQPVSGQIRMRLIDLDRRDSERAEVLLTVPQALEVIERLTRSVQSVCRRSDINAALHSTQTGMALDGASDHPSGDA